MASVAWFGSGFAVGAPASFLALGDSYTIGESVAVSERWPVQLASRLRADGTPVAEPEIVARTGWTTDELGAALDQAVLHPPYDLVALQIGVNNQYRGRPIDEYQDQFGALLKRAIGYAGGRVEHVFVLSIPDWGVTHFAREGRRDGAQIGRDIDAFNAVARQQALRLGVAWVDVTALSRHPGAQPEMLAADGLHPSAAQYRLWTGAVLPLVREMMQASPQLP